MRAVNLNSTYGVIVHRDFVPLKVDDNYARIFGYDSADHLLGSIDTLLDLIAPEDRPVAMQTNRELMSGKVQATTKTHSNVNSDGEIFAVLTLDHVIEWEGEPALQVTVVDLTLIEQANQKIRDNEKQYRELVTKSKQGILIHKNFRPLLVNDAWVSLYRGESVESVLQSGSVLDRIPEEVRQLAETRNAQLVSGEIEGGSILVENHCYDGSVRSFNLYENRITWDGEPAVQTVVEDVTEKVQLQKELAYKASHDQLTDLLNRDAVYEWISTGLAEIRTLSCLIIDIDNFKKINDTLGHYAGDKVIRAFAGICESEVGEHGVVARWGGEEYIVLLPNASHEKGIAIAERIRQGCENRMCRFGDVRIRSTVSIGVSTCNDFKEKSEFDRLLKLADDKMYVAKRGGKNRVCG